MLNVGLCVQREIRGTECQVSLLHAVTSPNKKVSPSPLISEFITFREERTLTGVGYLIARRIGCLIIKASAKTSC